MKKLLILFLLVSTISPNLFAQTSGESSSGECSELFFSELTFGKVQNGSLWDLNYAVEIFNPTQTTISLANYTLVLTDPLQNAITIPLNGSIGPWGTHIVCNDNADLNLQGLADELSSGLDFELYMMLDLKNNGNVIDRVGQGGTATNNTFDVNAFILDPVGYLANLHIDLNDFKTIDLRRGITITGGDPNFSTPADLMNNWGFYPNADRSNLGQHICRCNYATLLQGDPEAVIVELSYPNQSSTLNCLGTTNINVQADHNSGSTTITTLTYGHNKLFGGTATFGNTTDNLHFPSCAPSFLCTSTSGGFTMTPMLGVDVSSFSANYSGTRTATFELVSVTSSNLSFIPQINGLKRFHTINLVGCNPDATEDIFKKDAIKIYPNPSNEYVFISSNAKYEYSLLDPLGRLIKDGKLSQGENRIDLENLSNSIYHLIVSDEESGVSISRKLVVQE